MPSSLHEGISRRPLIGRALLTALVVMASLVVTSSAEAHRYGYGYGYSRVYSSRPLYGASYYHSRFGPTHYRHTVSRHYVPTVYPRVSYPRVTYPRVIVAPARVYPRTVHPVHPYYPSIGTQIYVSPIYGTPRPRVSIGISF